MLEDAGYVGNETRPKTWKDVENEECRSQYQTGVLVEEEAKLALGKVEGKNFLFIIGTESTCDTYNYCNGPLKPGTNFALTMRVFTRKGYSDFKYITIKTESEIPILFITITILSVMCVVFVIGFYISYRKTRALRYVM